MTTQSNKPIGSLSRREIFKGAAAGAAIAMGGGMLSSSVSAQPPHVSGNGDLALVNGKFVDGNGIVANAITIKNGRIVNVGQAMALGPEAKVTNLKGRTVIPGLFDGHVHYIRAGQNPGHTVRTIEAAFSIAELQEAISSGAESVPLGEFITCVGGWNQNQFAEMRLPTKAELDEAAPDHPVYISGSGGGAQGVVNGRGQIFMVANGVPVDDTSGVVSSRNAALAALRAVQTPEDRLRGVVDGDAYANSLGLTSVLDTRGGGTDPSFWEFPLEVWRQGKLTVRHHVNREAPTPEDAETVILNNFRGLGDDMFRLLGFGERIGVRDGSTFEPVARVIAQHGWKIQQHAGTVDEANAFIAAMQSIALDHPIDGLRWQLLHNFSITFSQLQALKTLGVGVDVEDQRYLSTTSGGPPYRLVVDSGIRAGAGTDSTNVAPLNPWLGLFYMTTGRNLAGNLTNDGQQISRLEALRLYTEGSAYFGFDENKVGSFEVGKYADLAVLSEDYLTVPDDRIRRIESVLTLLGGEVVHAAGPFSHLGA